MRRCGRAAAWACSSGAEVRSQKPEARMQKSETRIVARFWFPASGFWLLSPTLGLVAQQVIGQDRRHHRLADGGGADADAGVVTALGRDLRVLAVDVDGAPR